MAADLKTLCSRHFRLFLALTTLVCLFMHTISTRSWTTFVSAISIRPPGQTLLHIPESSNVTPDSSLEERLRHSARQVKVSGIDCSSLFKDMQKARTMDNITKLTASTPLSDSFYVNLAADCPAFQKQRGYIMDSLTEEEEQFPLAYSMIVYKDAEMVERLLRAIYRPQNVYCIHVDKKATSDTFKAISAIANCFTNVFIARRRIDVIWGSFTVLEPELVCMEELWRYPKWKYFINLTGQEFPLKTNYELVKILTAYNGAVDVSTTVEKADKMRWKGTLPPHGLLPVKGSVHIAVNRHFVDYILHNETAKELLEWTKSTLVPDETFFAILNANPQLGIKGTYKGSPENSAARPYLARYKIWNMQLCSGKRVRWICILTTGDLPNLFRAPHLFANKFYLHEDRVVIGCLEEKIFNDTRDEYTGSKTFNTTYYENLDFVKNKV